MKLLQQSRLFFKEGNSDKVYELDLCQIAENSYLVNFRYGKRGASLKEGTKTPESVPLQKAEQIFFELEAEKIQKGYQKENQVFVELPSLKQINPKSVKGVILHRLQDAVQGTNSFKTTWKTSRVIWKAGHLGIQESIPYILQLASKGDELQLYSSIYALTKLKAKEATDFFKTILLQSKQKDYLRKMATEGWFTVLEDKDKEQLIQAVLAGFPLEIRYLIDTAKFESLNEALTQLSEQKQVYVTSGLYWLTKIHPEIMAVVRKVLKSWPMVPPYFKQIRSIYKLAQLRNDHQTLAILAYKFEHETPMYRRTRSENSSYQWQYIPSLNEYIDLSKEFNSPENRLAFNQNTKNYFQNNALKQLYRTGADLDAKNYLQLAVALLLQYSEKDYSKAEERPAMNYGMYSYEDRKYHYTLIDYAECSDQLLLSTILFGKDPKRILSKKLQYIYGTRKAVSSKYYYSPAHLEFVEKTTKQTSSKDKSHEDGNLINSAVNIFKNIFSNKGEQKSSSKEASDKSKYINRLELYPEHWDALPEVYIQLLMQAQMNLIHEFAYKNLKQHKEYAVLIKKLDAKALVILLNSTFDLPAKFGMEVLGQRGAEFQKDRIFIADLLNSPSATVRTWALNCLNADVTWFTDDFDFFLSLIFNTRSEIKDQIDNIIKQTRFSKDRLEAIIGKVIVELIHLENNEENNLKARFAVPRIGSIASLLLEQVSWEVVGNLLHSSLLMNVLLASEILLVKSKKVAPTDIPLELVESFLQNEIKEVRENGIRLLQRYPLSFVEDNILTFCNIINSSNEDVVNAILSIIKKLIISEPKNGNIAIHTFIYALIRKEKFEGAHNLIRSFVENELKPFWNDLSTKDIVKLVHAQYRNSQLCGYEILINFDKINDFTLGQIISFGNHEILAIRTWCWNYFMQNIPRIRYEKEKALGILDSKWDDTRAFAFNFFRTNFTATDWDTDTLVGIVDSVRKDVEQFGKELIQTYFLAEHAIEYITKLSQHPSVTIQLFVTGYLAHYAADNPEKIKELDFYFRSVLTRVNKARVAKERIFKFLREESLKSEEVACFVSKILDDISAQSTIGDKAECIAILTAIKLAYPHLDMHLTIESGEMKVENYSA